MNATISNPPHHHGDNPQNSVMDVIVAAFPRHIHLTRAHREAEAPQDPCEDLKPHMSNVIIIV